MKIFKKMRNIINLGFTILTMTFIACADDNSLTSLQENDNPYTEKGISHFLNFSNENQFEAYMKQIEKKQSKTVYFNQSFGFTFKNGAIGPYTPTGFKIQDIDFFGAAKYNNMWKGIRIYKEKD